MTVQWSTDVRDDLLDQWETTIGTSAKIYVRTGAAPANCAAADSGTLLVQYDLVSDWATAASAGSKSLDGLPLSENAVAAGTAGHYRIKDSSGTTCHEQGTITATGGGGDATIDNVSISVGQEVQLTAYTKTAPGA
jgi:hypothetical protein